MEKQVYIYTESSVCNHAPDSKGIYFLGNVINNKFVVGYVGRSDTSTRKRLLSHNHKAKFTHFCFDDVKTKHQGFLRETEEWYIHKKTAINKVHPQVPEGMVTEHRYDTLGRVLKSKFGGNKK